jgi:hypothetical protein
LKADAKKAVIVVAVKKLIKQVKEYDIRKTTSIACCLGDSFCYSEQRATKREGS